MPPLYPKMRERPMEFRINYDAPLADGLVFAGLGGHGCVGSMVYPDSSLYGNHGRLINMDAATDWVWVPELGRWTVALNVPFNYAEIYLPTPIRINANVNLTWSLWLHPVEWHGANPGLWRAGVSADDHSFFMIFQGTSGLPWIRISETEVLRPNSGYAVALNTWTHVSYLVESASLAQFFANGKLEHSANHSVPTPNFEIYRFGWQYTRDQATCGMYGDTLMHARKLSQDEISALADPSNVDLRVGGVPLILPPRRRFWPVAVAEAPPAVRIFSRRQFGPRIGTRQVQV